MSAALQQASDSLRAVLREVFAAPEYEWRVRRRSWSWLEDLWLRLLDWLDALHTAHPVLYYVLLGLMTAVLVAILVHVAFAVWRALRPNVPQDGAAAAAPPPPRTAAWYLAEAHRLSGVGRYAEALTHRFLALVLELDGRRAVRFHPSKTPAEYVAEAQLDATARSQFSGLVERLYRHVFGGAPCGADDWGLFDGQAGALGGSHVAAR